MALSFLNPISGTRSYSANAYFSPNATRPSLRILCGARATRVDITPSCLGSRAQGVYFRVDGEPAELFVRAREDVFLCAGTMQTPQLLELSGIGEPVRLREHGIEVKVPNENVGENVQDHVLAVQVFKLKKEYDHMSLDHLRSEIGLETAMGTL